MKRHTRTVLLNLFTGVAIAATAALVLTPASALAQDPGFGFGFSIGPDGKPSVSIGIGTVEEGGVVCFYERTRYRGDSFCVDDGTSIRDLDDWAFEISSFRNESGLDVTLCTRTRLRGDCRTYTSSARSLGSLDDEVESLRVR